MNLLLIQKNALDTEGFFTVGKSHAEHLCCVLHSMPDDIVKIGIIGQGIGTARIVEINRKEATLQLISADTPPPPASNIIPLIALPRPQSFKKTLHFIASSGIRYAYFFQGAKTEKSYWDSAAMEQKVIYKNLCEGMEQGCTTIMPEISFFHSFHELAGSGLLEYLTQKSLPLIAHPTNAEECPRAVASPVSLLIGPEGGFTEDEVEYFVKKGFKAVTFGRHILRVEFALAYLAGRIQP